jgi:hypothetical protein
MHMTHGKKGSQRQMKPVILTFWPNWSGQGGEPSITFEGDDGKWYRLHFNSIDEAKEMLSQAHIAYGNVCNQVALDELKSRYRCPTEENAND